ncbi:MAG: ATP-binding cassette domain-containing protein, partial [Rhodobacteraceae bacterium]|nr:ATP-binding cassette domain-containing protein [Paracoccaceae bacterium]
MTLLSVRNLSLSIGRHPILSDVSFDIGEGQIFGLVGESGSGKSMTALALMGLAPASARVRGTAQFGGIDLLAQTERQMTRLRGRDIGMIFQEPMTALNPMKTIGDQVAETLLVHRTVSRAATRTDAQAVAAEKLARVGLPTDRFPLSLY